MFEKIEEIRKAKNQIVDGSLTIWNSRLDALIKAGDIRGAIDHIGSPVERSDNCGCGNNCRCAAADTNPADLPVGYKTTKG